MAPVRYGSRLCGLHAGDRLVEALPEDDDQVSLDLSSVDFVDPSGMISMVTACVESIAIGNRISIIEPANQNVANYLLRMRFRDVLRDEGVRFQSRYATRQVFAQPLADHLLELVEVTAKNATAIGEQLMSLGAEAGVPERVLRPAFRGLAEGVDNALAHSGTERAFAIAQRYRAPNGRIRLEVAVGDTGYGLRQTLRRRMEVADDASAVELAVTKGVSRYAGGRRGHGLSNVVDAVTSHSLGAFEIRSGFASLRVSRGRSLGDHAIQRDGVQLALSLTGTVDGLSSLQ